MYDVYYTTGGGPWVNAGTDTWINLWLELIAPKLKINPILLIHRNKPKGHADFKFPIEAHWHGDDITKFEKIVKDCRRIHILHGHYTPIRSLEENKHKIHSNVIHNSLDHILLGTHGTDVPLHVHPFSDSEWEKSINEYAKHSIWVGLYDIKYKNKNIPNFYEFKNNLPLSDSNKVGFAARTEARKNPHYMEHINGYVFTDSDDFKIMWKQFQRLDLKNVKIYHYDSSYKDKFYNMDWGISHSAFSYEPFGYGIFEAVDMGKLPIIHKSWCNELEYPYRASSKREFHDIYSKLLQTPFEEKKKWFNVIKSFMIEKFSDKDKWVNDLLNIYNI
jgi:hypothetical protein